MKVNIILGQNQKQELPTSIFLLHSVKQFLFLILIAIQVGEKRTIQVIAPTKKEGRFGPEPTCKVFATNPKGRTSELPIAVTATAFETSYKPMDMGTHKIKVEYMDKEVQGSPFSVDVLKPVDVSKVKVKGLETRKLEIVSFVYFYLVCWLLVHI